MQCEDFRDVISARLDGEALPDELGHVDAHLRGCADCRRFEDRAARVSRLVRVRLVADEQDVVEAVLATDLPRAARTRGAGAVRMALGGLGIGQAAIAISGIASAAAHHTDAGSVVLAGGSAAHLAHETSAWNLAIGVAFLLAATGARRIAGMVPVLAAFIAALAVLSVLDLIDGRVDVERLLGHGVAVAGLVLLVLLRRLADDGDGGAVRVVPDGAGVPAVDEAAAPGRGSRRAPGGGLAPSARRRAA